MPAHHPGHAKDLRLLLWWSSATIDQRHSRATKVVSSSPFALYTFGAHLARNHIVDRASDPHFPRKIIANEHTCIDAH